MFDERVMVNSEDDIIRAGRSAYSKYLREDKLYLKSRDRPRITAIELLRHFFGTDANVVNFWGGVVSKLFQFVLRNERGLLMEIVEQERFDAPYAESVRRVLRTLYDCMLTSVLRSTHAFGLGSTSTRAAVHEGFDAWMNAIGDNVISNPLRHLQPAVLNSMVAAEERDRNVDEIQLS